jgi:urease accessory protein
MTPGGLFTAGHGGQRSPPGVADAAKPGWEADLELSFEHHHARTVLVRNRHAGPLQVQKPLYPEGPDVCHVAILHPPGGIAAGDSLCLRAALDGRSQALLTTPGATKWYRSDGSEARQRMHFCLAGDAILEWLPRENILFEGCKISTDLKIELSAQSRYFGWEVLSFGRRASGESWRHGHLRMRTMIRRADRMLWSEMANIDAGSGFMQSSVGMSGFTVCGTFLIAGFEVENGLLAACRGVRPTIAQARTGITRVPGVLIARYLGDSGEEVFNYFTALWTVLRPALSARLACAPRLWAC